MSKITRQELSEELNIELNRIDGNTGKINNVQQQLDEHSTDEVKHITAEERNSWNSKQDALPEERIRKITFGTDKPTGGEHGDIYFQYE